MLPLAIPLILHRLFFFKYSVNTKFLRSKHYYWKGKLQAIGRGWTFVFQSSSIQMIILTVSYFEPSFNLSIYHIHFSTLTISKSSMMIFSSVAKFVMYVLFPLYLFNSTFLLSIFKSLSCVPMLFKSEIC